MSRPGGTIIRNSFMTHYFVYGHNVLPDHFEFLRDCNRQTYNLINKLDVGWIFSYL